MTQTVKRIIPILALAVGFTTAAQAYDNAWSLVAENTAYMARTRIGGSGTRTDINAQYSNSRRGFAACVDIAEDATSKAFTIFNYEHNSSGNNTVQLSVTTSGKYNLLVRSGTTQKYSIDAGTVTAGRHIFEVLMCRAKSASSDQVIKIVVYLDGAELMSAGDGSQTFGGGPYEQIQIGTSGSANKVTLYTWTSTEADNNNSRTYDQTMAGIVQDAASLFVTETSHSATISTDGDWTALDWDPDWPAGGGAGEIANLTVEATSTLTINEDETAKKLAVTSEAGNDLTLALGSGVTATVATYDFSGAAGKTAVNYGTGTAAVKAGADTVLAETGTGTLTIGSGLKATVPAWDTANVVGAGTIDISAASASTAVTWGETANFTGTMRLLKGTWTVSAGGNSAGYPRKSSVEVVGPEAMLKLTTANDATGYNGDLGKSLTIKDGGTLRVERRDTFSRTMNLDNGNVVFDRDATDSSRAFDLHGSATIHVTGTGTSTFGGTTAGSIVGSGIISLRNSPTITVDANAQFDIYSQWGGNSGYNAWTKAGAGKIVFYRPVQSSMTAKATVSAGTLQFADGGQGTLGEIALASGTKLELNSTASEGSCTAANAITGAGRVFKIGAGTYALTGANTYSGGTTVSAGTLAAATANLGTGAVSVNGGATLKLTLTTAQTAGATTLFTGTNTAEELNDGRVVTVNGAGTAIPGTFAKGENDAVVFTPSVEIYTLALTDGASVNWGDAVWTKNGESGQAYAPAEGKVGDVTVTVGGTATLNVTGTPASLGGIRFEKADGAETAVVTVRFTPTTLPESSAANVTCSVFGMVPTVGDGVTYGFEPALDAGAYAWNCDATAGAFIATKRPTMGSINIKIGPRTSNVKSSITPDLESVGANPLSGLLWTNAKLWNNNNSSYTDFLYVDDASGSGKRIQYVFRGPNTYFNGSNPQNTGNAILTASYVDDGDTAASTTWEVTNPDDSTDKVTLPAAQNARGWQIHLGNLPYAAFDLYFITASDQAEANLKETPIKLSADGGKTWVCYTGDSDSHQTQIGEENWKGSPYATGELVEAKNYLKMRVSAAIMGVDKLTSLEITHGPRSVSDKSNQIRSGLAAIQIVELDNDGVFTLAGDNGNWTTDAIWSSGGVTGKAWLNDGTAYAKIAADGTIASVTLDAAVNARQVTLTGDGDFTVNGSGTMASALGFDMSKFWGRLTMNAPVGGNYTLASGKLTLDNADAVVTLGGTASNVVINAGTLKFASKTVVAAESVIQVNGGTLDLNGLDIQHAYTLAGGALVNNGGSIGNGLAQMNGLTVTGDATIGGSGDFGLIPWSYGENTLVLGGNTLTKTGADNFWLCNTTVSGAGTIRVEAGTLHVTQRDAAATEATVEVGAAGALAVDSGKTFALKTLKGAAGSTISGSGAITLAVAEDVDFTGFGGTVAGVGGAIAVKGTVRTASGKFGGANITVADGAKIDLVIDASATEATITTGTLAFPEGRSLADCVTINGGSAATWKIKENGRIYDTSRQAHYAASVSAATATWSTKAGLTQTGEDGWANGANSTITLASETADAVLTFDAATTAATLKVTGEANLTLKKGADADVKIAAIDLTEATGTVTIDFDVGAATVASGASTVLNAVGTGNITVAAGQTLTVRASGLRESQLANGGTLNFEGGSEEAPIVFTMDSAASKVTLAADTYVKATPNGNKVYNVTGTDETSVFEIARTDDGTGVAEGACFRNVTVVCNVTKSGKYFWLERSPTDATVQIVSKGNGIYLNGDTTIGALSGSAYVTRYSGSLTIAPAYDADFSGGSGAAFVIASGEAVQTLSGDYTQTLTVGEGGKVRLTGSANPSSVSNAGTVILDFGAGVTNVLSGTSKYQGDIEVASGVAVVMEGFTGTVTASGTAVIYRGYTVTVNDLGTFTVPDGVDPATVKLFTSAGAEVPVTGVEGRVLAFEPLPKYGTGCLMEYLFDNTLASTGRDTGSLTFDGTHCFPGREYVEECVTNIVEGKEVVTTNYVGIYAASAPHRQIYFPTEVTVVMYGKMMATSNTCQIGIGSTTYDSRYSLFLASGDVEKEEVVLGYAYDNTGDSTNYPGVREHGVLCTMSVPHAQTTDHLYAFTLKQVGGDTVVNIYLDGEVLQPYVFKNTSVTLGRGFQLGSIHGGIGNAQNWPEGFGFKRSTSVETEATLGFVRIYDVVLNDTVMRQIAKDYPYESPSGSFNRELAGDCDWVETDAWNKIGEETKYAQPDAGSAVTLTPSDADVKVAVNLDSDVTYETLTVNNGGKVTFKPAAGKTGVVNISGKTTISTDVALDFDAVRANGAVSIATDKTVDIDLTSIDLKAYWVDTAIKVTGPLAVGTIDQFNVTTSSDAEGRTSDFRFNDRTQQTELDITVPKTDIVGTVGAENAIAWTWGGATLTTTPDWTKVAATIAVPVGVAWDYSVTGMNITNVIVNGTADIGTRRDLTFAGTGRVDVTLTAAELAVRGTAQTMFARAGGATLSIGTVRDAAGNDITPSCEIDGNRLTVMRRPTLLIWK